MVKVGDRLIVTGVIGHIIPMGSEVTVLEVDSFESPRNCKVVDERGMCQWVHKSDLKPISPPKKITQNGYEYELVGPVNPEWLVDGAWVVRKANGEMHQINQQSENMFSATSSLSRVTDLTAKRVSEEFRPHTSADWKWGDWALYGNERVFVIRVSSHGTCLITRRSSNSILDYVPVSELTPTF